MNPHKFKELTTKYSMWASWAIWNDYDIADSSIISNQVDKLHTNYVIVGLNISKPLIREWSNFHVRKRGGHDRKLCQAFNNANSTIRGAYMTDLLKEMEKDSKKMSDIFSNSTIKEKHKNFFQKELQDVGASKESIFILIGKDVQKYFDSFTDNKYPLTKSIRHYSDFRLKDEQWVKAALETIHQF